MHKVIIFIGVVLILQSCHSIDYDYIKSTSWEYDRGCKIGGDFIMFDKKGFIHLSHDTIFGGSVPFLIIKKLNKKKNELYVKDLRGNCDVVYINTEEFTQ